MKIKIFGNNGPIGEREVSDAIFAVTASPITLMRSLRVAFANARQVIAKTLTKAEVRGGGRKPFRQKGGGRSRQGSTRNPQYKGGGIAFGPRGVNNYSLKLPLAEKRRALFAAFSIAAAEGKLAILDTPTEGKKVSDYKELLKNLPEARHYLIYEDASDLSKALGNVPNVTVKNVSSVSVQDVFNNEYVFFTKEAIAKLESVYGITQ